VWEWRRYTVSRGPPYELPSPWQKAKCYKPSSSLTGRDRRKGVQVKPPLPPDAQGWSNLRSVLQAKLEIWNKDNVSEATPYYRWILQHSARRCQGVFHHGIFTTGRVIFVRCWREEVFYYPGFYVFIWHEGTVIGCKVSNTMKSGFS